MSFRIKGLPAETFQHLFALSDEELRARRALRRTVDEANAFPCRVSLTDAAPGEEVLLVNYEHHAVGFALPFQLRGLYPRRRRDL